MTFAKRVTANCDRRKAEGYILADRLAANRPSPMTFTRVQSYCGIRHSGHPTNQFRAKGKISSFVTDIRSQFNKPEIRNKKVTILVRAPNGLHTRPNYLKSFLQQIIDHCGVTAQLIFQFNKVCPEITPTNLRNFRGLGGITTFDGQDFLNHLKERKAIPDIARMLEILAYISNFKNSDGGNQDRNTLPPDDLTTPKEVSSLSSSTSRRT